MAQSPAATGGGQAHDGGRHGGSPVGHGGGEEGGGGALNVHGTRARAVTPHTCTHKTPPGNDGTAPGGVSLTSAAGAPTALAGILALAYLLVAPPAGDLAAAAYRARLFANAGLLLWDNGWYGGHYLLGYSVLSGALGALVGVRLLLAACTVLATAMFAAIAQGAFGRRAGTAAALWFAVSLSGEMLSGRVAYELGLAVGLGALLALQRQRITVALGLALCTGLASPVAAAFLALAALALAVTQAGRRAHSPGQATVPAAVLTVLTVLVAVCAVAAPLAFAVAFPEGGYEPFAASAFWPGLIGVALVGVLVARRHAVVAVGALLYGAGLVAAYAVHTPVGGNAARLGALVAGPILAGALWSRRPRLLALAAPALVYWALATPVRDLVAIAGQPALSASYYAPLVAELHELTGGAPTRLEVPMTQAHSEAQYLPQASRLNGTAGVALARGWERQLDTRDAALFYTRGPTAASYQRWLGENGVGYVALSDAKVDAAGRGEAALIAAGLPYLREVWRSRHWRLFAVLDTPGLANGGARISAWGADWFDLAVPHAGSYRVAVRYSPYWALRAGHGCVGQAPGGWTTVDANGAATVRVGIAFSLARIFEHGRRCR